MEAVRRCQALAKPIGGDITFKDKNKLANLQPEEKQKMAPHHHGSVIGGLWTSVQRQNKCTFIWAHVRRPAGMVETSTVWIQSAIYRPFLQDVKSHKHTWHQKDDVSHKNSFLYTCKQ